MDLNREEMEDLRSWAKCHNGEFPMTGDHIVRLIAEVERHRSTMVAAIGKDPWAETATETPFGNPRKIGEMSRLFCVPADNFGMPIINIEAGPSSGGTEPEL